MFALTDIETACGVTVDEVTAIRSRCLVMHGTAHSPARVIVPGDASPALAGAAARMALGVRCVYAGSNTLGHLVYHRAADLSLL